MFYIHYRCSFEKKSNKVINEVTVPKKTQIFTVFDEVDQKMMSFFLVLRLHFKYFCTFPQKCAMVPGNIDPCGQFFMEFFCSPNFLKHFYKKGVNLHKCRQQKSYEIQHPISKQIIFYVHIYYIGIGFPQKSF